MARGNFLPPSGQGCELWAEAIVPLLVRLMAEAK
jgi:hypothetical protein